MPVVIAYQSLNSNCSSTHGVMASAHQRFTDQAHDHFASTYTKPSALVLPVGDGTFNPLAVQGPAQLLPFAPEGTMDKSNRDGGEFFDMVSGKFAQLHQNMHREFGRSYDLLVVGELDGSHPDWHKLQNTTGSFLYASSPSRTCNCFTVYGSSTLNKVLGEGTGWIAVQCGNVVAVFVHVPNSVAKNQTDSRAFYHSIWSQIAPMGKQIDIVIGDTNQPSDAFTSTVVSKALNTTFADAQSGSLKVMDFHGLNNIQGTNSNGTQKYDVLVYNTSTVKPVKLKYLSQFSPTSSNVSAVTDHMGMAAEVERV